MTYEELRDALRQALVDLAAAAPPEPEPLPRGVRSSIRQLQALLVAEITLDEALLFAGRYDLRDFNEFEIAHLEGKSLHTVRRWRTSGKGPGFRVEGGISYPLREYLRWRERSVITRTGKAA
jgi:hypothetical protein